MLLTLCFLFEAHKDVKSLDANVTMTELTVTKTAINDAHLTVTGMVTTKDVTGVMLTTTERQTTITRRENATSLQKQLKLFWQTEHISPLATTSLETGAVFLR